MKREVIGVHSLRLRSPDPVKERRRSSDGSQYHVYKLRRKQAAISRRVAYIVPPSDLTLFKLVEASKVYRRRTPLSRELRPKFKLWLEYEGKPVIGRGGYVILKVVGEEGSLQKAAQRLGMSYRYLWGYIRNMEKALGVALVERSRGGREKGKAELTREGRLLLEKYEELERRVENLLAREGVSL